MRLKNKTYEEARNYDLHLYLSNPNGDDYYELQVSKDDQSGEYLVYALDIHTGSWSIVPDEKFKEGEHETLRHLRDEKDLVRCIPGMASYFYSEVIDD